MEIRDLYYLWRTENDLKQIEAAELIGVSIATYNKFEKYGICGPNALAKFSSYYKKNKGEFGGEDNV